MDPKDFLEKLNEYAEVKPIKPPKNGGTREADEPEEIVRQGQSFIIDKDTNPSWALEVKKLKTKPRDCEYCDKTVVNQIVNKRLLTFPVLHWRETCNICRMTKNPNTGKFDVEDNRVNPVFSSYFYHKNK